MDKVFREIKELKEQHKKIATFVFDGPMYCDINGIYCNTTMTNEMFSRYLDVSDVLVAVIRTIHLDNTYEAEHLHKVDLQGMLIVELPNILSLQGLFSIRQAKCIIDYCIKYSDLVFLRIPSISSDIAARCCKKNDKRYMVEVGGCAWDAYWNHSLKGKILAPLVYLGERKSVSNASLATYVTEKWLQNRYPCNCESISASNVYLKPFDDTVLEKRLAKIHNMSSLYNLRIGTIAGVDVRYKGQEYIIRAMSELKKQGIVILYELVGDGDPSFLKKTAQNMNVEDQVIFKGRMLHEDVLSWLDTIDLYAQPSRQEGLPRALIEAMSRGCPAIGSTTAGIPELLEKDVIFKNGDVKQIVNIISRMANEDLSKRAIRNYDKAKEYSKDIIYARRKRFYEAYRDMLQK